MGNCSHKKGLFAVNSSFTRHGPTTSRMDVATDNPTRERSTLKTPPLMPSMSRMRIDFEGYPLFLLLELLPRIPQLDDVELIRSVYDADLSAVEDGWGDWFYNVVKMESDEDRCKIFEATFRILPELAAQKVVLRSVYPTKEVVPLVALFYEWPQVSSVPIGLLDQVKRETDTHFSIAPCECKCSNKDEAAMWAIQNNFEICGPLSNAIRNSFCVEVVIAMAEKVALEQPRSVFTWALGEAIATAGPYWNERLLRLLWKHSHFEIDLSVEMPDWFRNMVASNARTEADISLCWWGYGYDYKVELILPTLSEMQRSTTLTAWTLESNDTSDSIVNAVFDVLRHCPSLRVFRFDASRFREAPVRIPFMPNLDSLTLLHATLDPESHEPMMSTAREICIRSCTLDFPSLAEERPPVPPECFAGWSTGLTKNSRIESLSILFPRVCGNYRVCQRPLACAIRSRPLLKRLCLDWQDHYFVPRPLDLNTEDMLQLGSLALLEHLDLDYVPPGGFESLLGSQPFNLRSLDWGYDSVMTKADFIAVLDFLAHPECKLEEIGSVLLFAISSGDYFEGDDERLKHPERSFINVLRDRNAKLKYGVTCRGCSQEEQAEMDFWCGMNKTCPNRLKLRQELSDAYPDQIAKYTNHGSYSEAFELIRSTFHLWSG